MSKVPVLVTGGAGYIGSHAVLALQGRGLAASRSSTICRTGRASVGARTTCRSIEGIIADRALVERIFAEQGIGAIMHFAGSIVVPEIVEKPLEYYAQQHGRDARADQRGGRRRA